MIYQIRMLNEEQINRELNILLCRKEPLKWWTRFYHALMSDVFDKIKTSDLEVDEKGIINIIMNIFLMWKQWEPELLKQSIELKIYVLQLLNPNVLNSK